MKRTNFTEVQIVAALKEFDAGRPVAEICRGLGITAQAFYNWTNNNHPIELVSKDLFYQKLSYIHDNPVRAAIVHQEKDYIYSSASNYANHKSIFEIDFI